MRTLFSIFLTALFIQCSTDNTPISLHPDNPHYLMFKGKPVVLIGSTEHYGAVLNLDFDYVKYLDELSASGMNVTRTFTGIYLEPQGAFNISRNSMAPAMGRSICPWARSSEPGYALGGNKFDLNKWDDEYFSRLKDFVLQAGKRNIVVELDLFSNFYDTIQWKLSPVHFRNNINNLPPIDDHKEVLSLRHPEILSVQEKMVQKIIRELNDFDNLYYEVCNEPYFGDVEALQAWEKHMTAVVVNAEKDLPKKHLVSNNIGNGTVKVEKPNEGVSILNFHYAKPPESVNLNYHFNMALGDNETGFRGIEDVHYRTEAWDFMTAGGALYNNLDYSFTVGHEDGTFAVMPGQPGGGGKQLRNQLKILAGVFQEMDFINMKPDQSLIKSVTGEGSVRMLAGEKEYLVYIQQPTPGQNDYSLRYTGSITAPSDGRYWFYTSSDDGVRLMIGEKLILENWNDHGTSVDSGNIDLVAGKKYNLQLEYYQRGGGVALDLKYIIPGDGKRKQIHGLMAPDGKTPGLMVEKFNGIDLRYKIGESIVTDITAEGLTIETYDEGKPVSFELNLEKGNYTGHWINTKTGERTSLQLQHEGGEASFTTPSFIEDIAIRLLGY